MLGKVKVLFGLTDFQKMIKGDIAQSEYYMLKIIENNKCIVIDWIKGNASRRNRDAAMIETDAMLKAKFPTVPIDAMKSLRAQLVCMLEAVTIEDRLEFGMGYITSLIKFLNCMIWRHRDIDAVMSLTMMNTLAVHKALIPSVGVIKTIFHHSWNARLDNCVLHLCNTLKAQSTCLIETKAVAAIIS